MRYTIGDILIDFKNKFVFKYTGKESSIYCVLATDYEKENFNKQHKQRLSFLEFKKISQNSDLRRKHRIYASVDIDENTYLHLRKLRIHFKYPMSTTELLNIMIQNFAHEIINKYRSISIEDRKSTVVKQLENIINEIKKL